MQYSDLEGKRVRFEGAEWIENDRSHVNGVTFLKLDEVGHPLGQEQRHITVPQSRWDEIEILGDA